LRRGIEMCDPSWYKFQKWKEEQKREKRRLYRANAEKRKEKGWLL